MKKEREAREQLERDAAAQKADAAKKAAAEAAAARKAERAPDKIKLRTLAAWVRTMPMPTMATSDGATYLKEVAKKVEQFAAWIETQAENLE